MAEEQEIPARLAAIGEYIARTSKGGRARVDACKRHLETRIGELLGPAPTNAEVGSRAIGRDQPLTPDERHDFRQMAAHPEVVERALSRPGGVNGAAASVASVSS